MVTENDIKTGGCLCGAVRFVARAVPSDVGVCHCVQCRRWTGSALHSVYVPENEVTWEGDVSVFTSSNWAERGFCAKCGTGLYFRMTDGSEWAGTYDMPIGIFDTADGLGLHHEIYVDEEIIQLADQGQKRMTRAECVAKNPKLDEA